MISVENVTKYFGSVAAVNNVSLHVEKQEIFGLVGPDGAGKTTLLRMICGLINPDYGKIELFGKPLTQLDKNNYNFGYMPQKFSLYGDLTISENINFFGSLYGLDYKSIKKRATETLSVTGLLPFTNRLTDKLSGGMKQKLALCCALITRPSLLILDEPTFGVDPESRREFWKILYTLNHEEGMTLIVTTPYMDEAELCSKIGFISSGFLRVTSSPTKLKEDFPFQVVEVYANFKDLSILTNIPGIVDLAFYGYKYRLITEKSDSMLKLLKTKLVSKYSAIEIVEPTMEDLFVVLAEREQ